MTSKKPKIVQYLNQHKAILYKTNLSLVSTRVTSGKFRKMGSVQLSILNS